MVFRDADWINAGFTSETARRFYTLSYDFLVKGHVELFNGDEVLPPFPDRHGRHPVGVQGNPGIGLWPMFGTPHWVVPKRFKSERDFYYSSDTSEWIVSERVKHLLIAIDGEAFEFAEAHVTRGVDEPMALEPYWRVDVIRVLDCIDDAASEIDGTPSLADPSGLWYVRLIDIKFKIDLPEGVHAFRVRQGHGPVFDNAIVDKIRSLKYKGLRFTPLQMPTFAETQRADIGSNSEYWRQQSPIKDYWTARNAEGDRRYREKLAREAT